jgi:hypothetical protein
MGSLKDVRSWLAMYGEPDPGKIPTGSMTTFAASRPAASPVNCPLETP